MKIHYTGDLDAQILEYTFCGKAWTERSQESSDLSRVDCYACTRKLIRIAEANGTPYPVTKVSDLCGI